MTSRRRVAPVFTTEEDIIFLQVMENDSRATWRTVSDALGNSHTPRQCRDHWLTHLAPYEKSAGTMSQSDVRLLFDFVAAYGTKWEIISHHFEGRTPLELKNVYIRNLKDNPSFIKANFCSSSENEVEKCSTKPESYNYDNVYDKNINFNKGNNEVTNSLGCMENDFGYYILNPQSLQNYNQKQNKREIFPLITPLSDIQSYHPNNGFTNINFYDNNYYNNQTLYSNHNSCYYQQNKEVTPSSTNFGNTLPSSPSHAAGSPAPTLIPPINTIEASIDQNLQLNRIVPNNKLGTAKNDQSHRNFVNNNTSQMNEVMQNHTNGIKKSSQPKRIVISKQAKPVNVNMMSLMSMLNSATDGTQVSCF
ncbi:hypothetical protein TRFO_09970 [Tritrichomonas foetus]|uniref:Myb-like DNA-binding domain containing protein n=1 Tax=Tritrichomonas foetus TaxID=1144522 RepID=A0A1J4JFA6_9EUKA|nr:hypothetical protein TRFO_09970 [Tritrichomonas foetus]|eukprot:OHS96331.1 hypothetical protein TRFO_09970 [Tritrichomonas foetus]